VAHGRERDDDEGERVQDAPPLDLPVELGPREDQ
jgi:hypothetical protein